MENNGNTGATPYNADLRKVGCCTCVAIILHDCSYHRHSLGCSASPLGIGSCRDLTWVGVSGVTQVSGCYTPSAFCWSAIASHFTCKKNLGNQERVRGTAFSAAEISHRRPMGGDLSDWPAASSSILTVLSHSFDDSVPSLIPRWDQLRNPCKVSVVGASHSMNLPPLCTSSHGLRGYPWPRWAGLACHRSVLGDVSLKAITF